MSPTPEQMFAAIQEHSQAVTADLEGGATILGHAIRSIPSASDGTQMRAAAALALDTVMRLRKVLTECERIAQAVDDFEGEEGVGASS